MNESMATLSLIHIFFCFMLTLAVLVTVKIKYVKQEMWGSYEDPLAPMIIYMYLTTSINSLTITHLVQA